MIAQTKIFAPQQLLLQILQYFLNFCHNFSSRQWYEFTNLTLPVK